MFTGIVEEVGRVATSENVGGGRCITITAALAAELQPNDSVAVNGACLTVERAENGSFEVTAVEETLYKTTLGRLEVAEPVNLERGLAANARIDGHLVQGHIDTTGQILGIERLETSHLYRIRFGREFASHVISKGSISVDGISLTVARLHVDELTVSIIPHTYANTNVPQWTVGRRVNLEFDLIGKYIARWMEVREEGDRA